jgi:hypothetical protein
MVEPMLKMTEWSIQYLQDAGFTLVATPPPPPPTTTTTSSSSSSCGVYSASRMLASPCYEWYGCVEEEYITVLLESEAGVIQVVSRCDYVLLECILHICVLCVCHVTL